MIYTGTKKIINERRTIQISWSSVFSAFTIIGLISVIVLFSFLNFNLLEKINRERNQQTILYKEAYLEEKAEVLRINF